MLFLIEICREFVLGGLFRRKRNGRKAISEGMEEKWMEMSVFPPDLSAFEGITSSKYRTFVSKEYCS